MKSYYRYQLLQKLGLICSPGCSPILVRGVDLSSSFNQRNLYVICGGYDDVFIWDTRKHEKVDLILPENEQKGQIMFLLYSKSERTLFVGHSDGAIVLWDMQTLKNIVCLEGHSSAITTMIFEHGSVNMLISGSLDNNIIVWDTLNHCGLFKLIGHKAPVTHLHVVNRGHNRILFSSSKDTLIMLWDLDTQHCFATLTENSSEVWSFAVFNDCSKLLSFSSDNELRLWDISYADSSTMGSKRLHTGSKLCPPISANFSGSIYSESKVRTLKIELLKEYILQLDNSSCLNIYKIMTEKEILKRMKKRGIKSDTPVPEYLIKLVAHIKLKGSVNGFTTIMLQNMIKLCLVHKDNFLEILQLTVGNTVELSTETKIMECGHRRNVTSVAIDYYNNSFLTISVDSVKIWDFHNSYFIRTLLDTTVKDKGRENSANITHCLFLPDHRHFLCCFEDGVVRTFVLSTSELQITIKPFAESTSTRFDIKGYIVPNMTGIVLYNRKSVEGEHDVQFWEFELSNEENSGEKFTLSHTRTLKLGEAVLNVKMSQNMNFILVSLMDSTIKVFYFDTFKFYVSLYGHKLPVPAIDISSDNLLIATGSVDKNIKLWGMDFGDCHRSIFAHNDAILDLKFVPQTHYLFSVGKDKRLRYWDTDKYALLLTFESHFMPVLSLDLSKNGERLVTVGEDRSICVWEQTDEQFVIEQEKQIQYDLEMEKSIAEEKSLASKSEVGRTTVDTIAQTEYLVEAIDLCVEEEKLNKQTNGDREPNVMLMGKQPREYVLHVFRNISSSQIEEALSILPTSHLTIFIQYLVDWLKKDVFMVELCSRCIIFLFKVNFNFLVNKINMDSIQKCIQKRLRLIKDLVGFNIAALRFIENEASSMEAIEKHWKERQYFMN